MSEGNPVASAHPAVPEHHPIFRRFGVAPVESDATFTCSFVGDRIRNAYLGWAGAEGAPVLPAFDEEYFEWIDVLEAVEAARGRFTMIELGAGFGRWLVRAVAALRRANPMPFDLVAVEGEPTHYRWLQEHFEANGIDPSEHRLIEAAVSDRDGWLHFQTGDAVQWYGQRIARRRTRVLGALRRAVGLDRSRVTRVRAVRLAPILAACQRVDLLDLDVQGAEAEVLEAAASELDARVARVHVGTHSHPIEDRLRGLFGGAGWRCLNDYPCQGESPTPYGRIRFDDGVQTWLNPRFESAEAGSESGAEGPVEAAGDAAP